MELNEVIANKTPAAVYAQCELTRDGLCEDVLIFDVPNYRSDKLFPDSEWERLIAAQIAQRPHDRNALRGTYDVTIYIAPKRETDASTSTSFRENIALAHTGHVIFSESGNVHANLMKVPRRSGLEGYLDPISDKALATWSYDLEDMLNAYDAGVDPEKLIEDFLASHV